MNTVNIANVGELKGLLAASRSMGMTVVILKIPVRLFAIDPAISDPEQNGKGFELSDPELGRTEIASTDRRAA